MVLTTWRPTRSSSTAERKLPDGHQIFCEDVVSMPQDPPTPSEGTIRAALRALRALRKPATEADVTTQFPLLFLPCLRGEPSYERRPRLFLTALALVADELADPVERLAIGITLTHKKGNKSLEQRNREVVDRAKAAGHRSKNFDARAEGDKAIRYVARRLSDRAFADEFAARSRLPLDASAYETEQSEARGYRWITYDVHVEVPTPPSRLYTFTRSITFQTLRPDQRFFLLDYLWAGSGSDTTVQVASKRHVYLDSVPLPEAENEDWNTLVFYLGEGLALGAPVTIAFTQELTDEKGDARPIIAVGIRYEGMTALSVAATLPRWWKAFQVDVLSDGFGTKVRNRKELKPLRGRRYVRQESDPKPGYGRAIEWKEG